MKAFLSALVAAILLLIHPIQTNSQLPIITEAYEHLDKPYVYTAAGPNSFDCSGFTYYLFKTTYDIQLPHSAYLQGYNDVYEKIETIDELLPGDIVCFDSDPRDQDKSDHVGLYLGDGEFIHAAADQKKVVISTLTEGFYNKCFSWGKRIISEEECSYDYND